MKKSEHVTINVPVEEKKEWNKFVKKLDMSMSSFARRAVNVYIAMLKRQ